MTEMILFCYLLGTANNSIAVGLHKMGFANFVSQVTGRTADAEHCVSSSSTPESPSFSARIVFVVLKKKKKKVGGILL